MILYPLIAKAQGTKSPYYSTPSYVAVLDPNALSWEQVQNNPVIVEHMVRRTFADAPIMVDVARAESQFVPTAKNPKSTAKGVFQILDGTFKHYKCDGNVLNASDNIRCARKIYDHEGTEPWNSSKDNW